MNRSWRVEFRGSIPCKVKVLPLTALIIILGVADLCAYDGATKIRAATVMFTETYAHPDYQHAGVRSVHGMDFGRSLSPANHGYAPNRSFAYFRSTQGMTVTSNFNGSDLARRDTVPKPSSVMLKSMMLPGWGQVVNRQVWKVPIIYGMLAGLTYYSILMDQNYRDYRAAFYNSQYPDGDQKFGPTPLYIDPNQNPEALRHTRNLYRNRRDLTIIGVVLAYGLNIVDAYVFAQMRDFDVSDDLSARIHIGPATTQSESTDWKRQPFLMSGWVQGQRSMDSLVLTLQLSL